MNKKIFLVAMLGIVLAFGLILAGCDNGTTGDTAPTVTGVTVSPASASVMKGTTKTFTTTATGTNSPAQTVTWSIVEIDKNAGTTIDTTGTLTVAADESLTSLTVKATSTLDTSKNGIAIVTVTVPTLAGMLVITPPEGEIIDPYGNVLSGLQLTAAYSGTEGPVTFQWKNGESDVASGTTYTPGVAGTYTVTASVSGYLSKTSSVTVVQNLPNAFENWEYGGNGFTRFYTNYSSDYNNSFLRLYDHTGVEYSIQTIKMSGYSNAGYGMIFAAKNVDNYYEVDINVAGQYSIWKCVNGTYSQIKSWTSTDKLYTGYNQANNITVNGAGGWYTVYFNGNTFDSYSFSDSSVTGGYKIGFIADVGSAANESFPNDPVDVRSKVRW